MSTHDWHYSIKHPFEGQLAHTQERVVSAGEDRRSTLGGASPLAQPRRAPRCFFIRRLSGVGGPVRPYHVRTEGTPCSMRYSVITRKTSSAPGARSRTTQ